MCKKSNKMISPHYLLLKVLLSIIIIPKERSSTPDREQKLIAHRSEATFELNRCFIVARVKAWDLRHYLLVCNRVCVCVCLELIRTFFLHEFIGYLHTDWLSSQSLFNHHYGDIIHTCLSGSLLFALRDAWTREWIFVHLALVPSVMHKVQWNNMLHLLMIMDTGLLVCIYTVYVTGAAIFILSSADISALDGNYI